ncbi:gamma-glutamyl-gamma-aminobutyrate hydrolase family protein [Bacillaceae bacterium Marseille-Q3522]|nr:gamma-glutamyl-gamma-aminobutyrate hydrolase family protein [Bacillaceae bacterium Marseille-Q3522]
MRPLIGITGYYVTSTEMGTNRLRGVAGQDIALYSYDYVKSLQRAGATAVLLPIDEEKNHAGSLLDRLDGLLLAGGSDVNPYLYGEAPSPYLGSVEQERDEFEFALMQEALERNFPVLGICRGIQVIAAATGGTLYQDLEKELGPEYVHSRKQFRRWQGSHSVTVSEDSKVFAATGQTSLIVNSYHHQAVKTLGKDFKATAYSFDGVIEAIESEVHDYIAAVQWHPEMMSEKNPLQQGIFQHFVDHICKKSS